MKQITIQIPDMVSQHCQMRVSNLVNSLDGAKVNIVQPGLIEMEVADDEILGAALEKISNAGYSVQSENKAVSGKCECSGCHN